MNEFEDFMDGVKGFFLLAVLGFTCFFLFHAPHKAVSGHHLAYVFCIPFHLRPPLIFVFYLIWVFYWLTLWNRLDNYLPDPNLAIRVHRLSWFFLILIIGLWIYLPFGKPAVFHFLTFNPGMKMVWKATSGLLGVSFPIVLLGVILVVVADRMGLSPSDPIERELFSKVRWKRRVNHAKYFKKAAKKGLTYIGFEVSWRRPMFLTPKERNEHVHIVGTTGSGKTRYVLFPMLKQDIESGKGVIFIDAKASDENARVVKHMASQAGREEDLFFFSLTHLDRSRTLSCPV